MSLARPTASSRPEDRLLELIDEQVPPDRAPGGPGVRARVPAAARRRRQLGGHRARGAARRDPVAVRVRLRARRRRDGGARLQPDARASTATSRSASVLETNTDDLPFLVDSVSGELASRGIARARGMLHPIIATEREGNGRIRAVRDPRGAAHRESVMHFDLDRRLADDELAELEDAVRGDAHRRPRGRARLPGDARARGVDDASWPARAPRATRPTRSRRSSTSSPGCSAASSSSSARASTTSARTASTLVPGSGLGILADEEKSAFAQPGRRQLRRAAALHAPQRARRRPAAGRQGQRPRARAPARADGLHRRPPRRRGRRDHRHVAPARPVHDQGLRRAGLRDAAAGPQAAPVPGGPRADRGLARLQGRRRAVRHLPEGRAVRRAGRRPARRASSRCSRSRAPTACGCSAAATSTGATPR